MNNEQFIKVNTKSIFWVNKEIETNVIRDVMKGGKKLLKYLIKYDGETDDKFEKRRALAIEKPIAKDMVKNFVDKCTKQGVTIDTNDVWLQTKIKDFDGYGLSIHEFAKKLLYNAEPFSESYVMVENKTYSGINDDPLVNIIDINKILHHRVKDQTLQYFRIREFEIIERQFDDAIRTVVKEFYVENGKLKYNRYQDNGDNNFNLVSEAIEINFDSIPLVEFYPNGSVDRFLVDRQWGTLCDNQTKHINYYSQYLNLSKNTSYSFIAAYGIGKAATELVFTTDSIVVSDDVNARIEWVNSLGTDLVGTLKTVEKIENDMQNNSLNVNVNKQSITATQSIIDESTINSILTNHAMALKTCIEKVIELIIKMKYGVNKKIDYTVVLSTDFTTKLEQISLQHLNDLHDRGLISDKTRFNESKKEGYVDESLTYEGEQAQINKEAIDKVATDANKNYFDNDETEEVVVRDEKGVVVKDDSQSSS